MKIIIKKLFFTVFTAALVFVLSLPGNAFAAITTTYTFTPHDSDIDDLDHNYMYSWLVSGALAENEIITSASLTFTKIINWNNNPHDLYVHLLNTPITSGTGWSLYSGSSNTDGAIWRKYDGEGGGDGFGAISANNTELIHYKYDRRYNSTKFTTDADGSSLVDDISGRLYFPSIGGTLNNGVAKDINYYFSSDELAFLNTYFNSGDNSFGIGFDPDCHYFNDGIYLTLVTQKVNEQGVSPTPEPATLLLFGSGLVALAGIGRKHLKK